MKHLYRFISSTNTNGLYREWELADMSPKGESRISIELYLPIYDYGSFMTAEDSIDFYANTIVQFLEEIEKNNNTNKFYFKVIAVRDRYFADVIIKSTYCNCKKELEEE